MIVNTCAQLMQDHVFTEHETDYYYNLRSNQIVFSVLVFGYGRSISRSADMSAARVVAKVIGKAPARSFPA